MAGTSLDRYTEFLEALPDAALLIDEGGTAVFANSRLHALLDYEAGALIGRSLDTMVPERCSAQCRELLLSSFSSPRTRPVGEDAGLPMQRRDGREVPVDVAVSLQRIGRSNLALCLVRDAGARKQLEELVALGAALQAAHSRPELLELLLDELQRLLGAIGAAVVIKAEDEAQVVVDAARGVLADLVTRRYSAGSISAKVMTNGEPYVSNDPAELAPLVAKGLLTDAVRGLACAPLQANGEILGMLGIVRDSPVEEHDEYLLRAIGDAAALSLQRLAFQGKLIQDASSMEDAYEDMLHGWARSLDRRERITDGHSQRVTDLTVRLARVLGVGRDDLPQIRRGALLHDIGKMMVPEQILLKAGPLDEDEQTLMRRHTEYAYDLLGPIEFLRPALTIPSFHHERWDGSGYPRGLRAEAIPLAARIFAVADVYDTIISDRPYQESRSSGEALQILVDESGRQFDPRVVEALLSLMSTDDAVKTPTPRQPRGPETRS